MQYSFQLISDIHLESGRYVTLKRKAPYLLLAGDIGYPSSQIYQDFMKQCSKKFDKLFYTSGNHEYYDKYKSITDIDKIIHNTCQQYDNVHYLQNSYYDLDGLRIVGSTLWSDVQDTEPVINDYSNIRKSLYEFVTIQDTIQMFNKNKEYIESVITMSDKPILIMTHHMPSYEMILPEFQASDCKSHFTSHLDYLFKKPVVTWVCGHGHGFNSKMINDIPCIMNAVGYPSEPRRGASLDYVFKL